LPEGIFHPLTSSFSFSFTSISTVKFADRALCCVHVGEHGHQAARPTWRQDTPPSETLADTLRHISSAAMRKSGETTIAAR